MLRWRHFRLTAIIIILVLVLLIAWLIFFLLHSSSKENDLVCTNNQNRHLIDQAVPLIKSDNYMGLYKVSAEIEKLPNYQKDPNCDYILFSYYLAFDYKRAESSYNNLEKYYVPSRGYFGNLNNVAQPIQVLKEKLSNFKQFTIKASNSTKYSTGEISK